MKKGTERFENVVVLFDEPFSVFLTLFLKKEKYLAMSVIIIAILQRLPFNKLHDYPLL